jgi:hypothetical protein
MNYDWDYVKKVTLWQYEDLLKKLNAVLAYPLIRNAYNHSMPQAMDFARHMFAHNNIAAGDFPASLIATFGCLQNLGVRDWADLLERLTTRESCAAFVEKNNMVFEEVIDVLKYVLRWALPFHTNTRELFDQNDAQEMESYPTFKQHKLMCSFDLLEHGYTKEKRKSLAKQTNLPLDFVTLLVHRADIARLPYVRRKTILPVCGAGYNTLAKIATADLSVMDAHMETYFQHARGKQWCDFKSVIVLRGLVNGARALPELLQS